MITYTFVYHRTANSLMLSQVRNVITQPALVWYVSYGSNMCAERLGCYLAGGLPAGARQGYAGCRDRRPPLRTMRYELAGGVYFATESVVWGGGRAFYDQQLPGTAVARAYLIASGQFADIASQEMNRATRVDIDLTAVLATGRVELGAGRYETLVHLGDLQGYPLLTFTAPWHARDVCWTTPSAPYLRMLIAGLRETYGWDNRRIGQYLAGLPGARGRWTAAAIAAL